jgi:RHS repeat-associated protein
VLKKLNRSVHRHRFGVLTGDHPTGRLRGATHIFASPEQDAVDTTFYDAAGNVLFSYQPSAGTDARLEDHAYYYGADGKLRVSEYRWAFRNTPGPDGDPLFQMVFDEYRYDALGRRVLARTRRASNMPGGCNLHPGNWGTLRRTVWDGDAELYEIQMYGGRVCAQFNDESNAALENDTLPIVVKRTTPELFEISNHFGRVAYTHGPGLDQPLSLIRINFVDSVFNKPRITWAPIAAAPHWNWRGQADFGTLADGGWKRCQATDTLRCVAPTWRTQGFMFTQQPADTAQGWWGTLLGLKEDATGTQYRRNRYVDPATGRFTQEDPIGLAGGLNLYGFANGDPVNFSDPFGLCPPADTDVSTCAKDNVGNAWRALDQAGKTGKTLIANVVAGGFTVDQRAFVSGDPCGTHSCLLGKTITLNEAAAPGALAAAIGHEYEHSTQKMGTTERAFGQNELAAWDATLKVARSLKQPYRSQAFGDFQSTFNVIQGGPSARAAAVKQWGCNAAKKAGLPCSP